MSKAKNYFITGLISSLPIFLTVLIIIKIFEMITKLIKVVIPVEAISDILLRYISKDIFFAQMFITFFVYSVTFVVFYFIIMFTGIMVKHFIVKEKVRYIENFFMKIPLAKPIYSTLKQISEMLFSQNFKSYKKVVILEYPRKGIYSLGFLTSAESLFLENIIEDKDIINIFIPTSPNPTSGMFVMVPKKEIIEIDMKVEDAVKLIISGGAIVPPKTNKEK